MATFTTYFSQNKKATCSMLQKDVILLMLYAHCQSQSSSWIINVSLKNGLMMSVLFAVKMHNCVSFVFGSDVVCRSRVARWYIFIPNPQIFVYFGRPCNIWYRHFSVIRFFVNFVYFGDLLYIFYQFWYFVLINIWQPCLERSIVGQWQVGCSIFVCFDSSSSDISSTIDLTWLTY
jgi:hypothetical protein